MDRAENQAAPLTTDELQLIFEVIDAGGKQGNAREYLPLRDRTTINRAYNVVIEFERLGLTSLNDTIAGEIAEAAKYSTTVSYVQDLFLKWKAWKQAVLPYQDDSIHQQGLRKMISHIADWVRDWSTPRTLVSPAGPTVMPYGPDAKPMMAWQDIEQDPVYQALLEHLEGTETWKDFARYGKLRRLYWWDPTLPLGCNWRDATLPRKFDGPPEWVRSQEEKLAEVRKTQNAIREELEEVTYKVSHGFREILLLPRIPGKCHWCRGTKPGG